MHMSPGTRIALLATALALGACQRLADLAGAGTVAGRETGTAGPSAGTTATARRTDPDMVQVINVLAALGAKPTGTLSV